MSNNHEHAPLPQQLTDGDAGYQYHDAEVDGATLTVTEDSLAPGALRLTTHDDSDGDGPIEAVFLLTARDRVALAMQLLDGVPGVELGTPAKNPAKYQAVIDTHTTFGEATPAGLDKLLARLAWHVRNGIPAKVIEPEGGVFTLNEVSEGEVPPRMSETRRHFRYQLPGSTEWHYHNNFRKITEDGGRNVQFQRSYKSDWEDV